MRSASAVRTHSGRSGKVDYCVFECVLCKVQEPRARQIAKWSFSQANGVSQFILFFSAGATSQNFPNPTAIDQFRSVKERRRPDYSEGCRNQCGIYSLRS